MACGGCRTPRPHEAARLLVDAVGRDLGLDLVEGLRGLTVASMAYVQVLQDAGTRGIEPSRIFEALVHVEHADTSIEVSRDLAVDGAADLCETRRWREVASPDAAFARSTGCS